MSEEKDWKFNRFYYWTPEFFSGRFDGFRLARCHPDSVTGRGLNYVKQLYRDNRINLSDCRMAYESDGKTYVKGVPVQTYDGHEFNVFGDIEDHYSVYTFEEDEPYSFSAGIEKVNEALFNPNPEWLEEEGTMKEDIKIDWTNKDSFTCPEDDFQNFRDKVAEIKVTPEDTYIFGIPLNDWIKMLTGEESDSSDNVEKHKELVDGIHETYKQKNAAYGDSFSKSVEKYGLVAALTRMSDKWNRLENLILNNNVDTGDEALKDTLLDLANYCIMTVMCLDDKEDD